jgi:hypothetical protein
MLFARAVPFYSDKAAKANRVALLHGNFCHEEEICLLLLKIAQVNALESERSKADVTEYRRMW